MSVLAVLASASMAIGFSGRISRDADAATTQQFSVDEAHENVLSYHPAEWIISSGQLYEYLSDHAGENHTIYIEDGRMFVHISSVNPSRKRQDGVGSCQGYNSYEAVNHKSGYSNWTPASQCLYTGDDPAGATQSMAWSYSIAYQETEGVSWTIIKDVLSASLGFSITETFTKTDTFNCNISGNSVGQIWAQTLVGTADMNRYACESCAFGDPDCWGKKSVGTATAPSDNTNACNTGCSIGYNLVHYWLSEALVVF